MLNPNKMFQVLYCIDLQIHWFKSFLLLLSLKPLAGKKAPLQILKQQAK
jgi:hypothetical protein